MKIKLSLKEYRKIHGLTQKDVADKLGVHTTVISDYELGKLTPSLERTIELANLFNLSLDEFVKYENEHSKYSEELKDIMKNKNSLF